MALSAIVYSHRKALTIGAVAMVATLIVLFPPAGLLERFQSIKLTGEATNGAENSIRTHVELARAGWNMVLAHPLVGIGLDRFKSVAPNYNPDLLSTAGRSYIAHDTYVQIAAKQEYFVSSCFSPLLAWPFTTVEAHGRVPTNEWQLWA